MLNIVLFGPPGAGKGTQSEHLISRYNLMHISTGDILRNAIEQKTPRGIQAQKYMNRGELVPDELVTGIIGRRLEEHRDKVRGFIFDGFPRTTNQALELDNMLAQKGTSIALILGLEVEQNELVARMENRGKITGRADDQNIDIIQNRINVYNQATHPVMEYYKEQGKYVGINGMGTIDEIFQRICIVVDQTISGSKQ